MTKTKQKRHLLLNLPIITALVMFVCYVVLANTVEGIAVVLMPGMSPLMTEIAGFVASVGAAYLISLAIKARLKNGYILGFRSENFAKCLMLGWLFPAVLIVNVGINFINNGYSFDFFPPLTLSSVLIALVGSMTPGFGEELLYRSVMANNMMRVWGSKKYGIYGAVFASALIFGLVHILNGLIAGFTAAVFWQAAYATGLGLVFGAMYMRTRNLWGCILMHTVFDFLGLLSQASEASSTESLVQILQAEVGWFDIIYNSVLIAVSLAVALYLIRPSKHAQIKANWNLEEPADQAVTEQ